ncbi:MAG TPA: galactokinase family protein [Candidatus Hydrogenedentes bacterium]|nr:galactokinase family protein [Candidatus Hydrogenedentota bacterium]
MMNVSAWLERLDHPPIEFKRTLRAVYGSDESVVAARLRLLRRVLGRFRERFGDGPVRVFRAPGRINLRGMHVDTHGGYLNLMTHQREVLAAVQSRADADSVFVNTDPHFEETVIRTGDARAGESFRRSWTEYILSPGVRREVEARRGHWSHYLAGAWLGIQHRFPDVLLCGMNAAIGSDLPRGASLSSSAALCVAVCSAVLALNGKELAPLELILAARDAEWYTGSRCGLSDQAAIILGGQGELVNLALFAPDLNLASLRRMAFPETLRILVVNSYTERSLSGAALVAYTRNRFAYSLAMEILRQEMRRQGFPEPFVAETDRLSRVTQERIPDLPRILCAMPDALSLADLRARYALPGLDEAYRQYFGTVPEDQRPDMIHLRGPLLFGIAESERARRFADALADGDWGGAGRLMSIGHDGDRLLDTSGRPYRFDVSDGTLAEMAAQHTPIEMAPGAYGASAPVLDGIVDAAIAAGALGSSLTGAGMAGTVLALCRAEDESRVVQAVRDWLGSDEYVKRAGKELGKDQLDDAVHVNAAPAAAAELHGE